MQKDVVSAGHKEMSSTLADQYSALVYELSDAGGGGTGPQPMSTDVHILWSPNKLWRSYPILWMWLTGRLFLVGWYWRWLRCYRFVVIAANLRDTCFVC
jgi:hypothetical protein